MRAKIPFGIAQIGKAFRNEVTPGNFIFRTIEFEQMEYQLFCKEGEDEKFYEEYKQKAKKFLLDIGINEKKLRFKDHDKLSHYARAACDIQYEYPIGWAELNGIHNRTNYDLKNHGEYSGKSMEYTDPFTNEKFIPWVVEYSIGADRLMLVVLCDAYHEEKLDDGEIRVVLKLHPKLAAYKVAVMPLQKDLNDTAKQIFSNLAKDFMVTYDEAGSIGKRYRRQDEIGTPFCITVDYDTKTDNKVTVRDRDSMKQERVEIAKLSEYLNKAINS
jgi:glycyl-tRNA synthetase